MDRKEISPKLLARLPVYLKHLKSLPEDTTYTSATKIAKALELGDVLVRKDLAKVSRGGRCRLGYACEDLIYDLEKFLEIQNKLNAVAIGKKDTLRALMSYEDFEENGIRITAGFDPNCRKPNTDKRLYPIDHLKTFCLENTIQVGIIMVSARDAQNICNQLVSLGIKGIWNFTSAHLYVPENVVLQNENIATSVARLRIHLKKN